MRPTERPLSPGWLRGVAIVGLGLVMSALAWLPMLRIYPATQSGDGWFYHRVIEAAKVSFRRYHELPLWNPYECGGIPLWDNPQSIVGAPLVLLAQPLTATVTLMVWYLAHSALGFAGMWLLCRHEFGLSRLATFTASVLWAFGTAHASQYAGGHTSLAPFLYMPLALLLWRRAEVSLEMAVLLGLLFAWMFYEGAVYPLPHTGLILAAEALTRMYPPRRAALVVRAGAIAGVVFFLVAAARLLPVVDQLTHFKRPLEVEVDALSYETVRDMYLARDHEWHVAGQTYVWGEYIAYMGIGTMLLAVVGLLVSGVRNLWFFAVGLFAFTVMLGHFHPDAPWHILREHVFPFKSMRVPSRFRLIVAMFIAAWVGMAIDRLPGYLERLFGRRRILDAFRVAIAGIALVCAGDVVSVASGVIATKFGSAPEQKVPTSPRLYIDGPGLAAFIDQPRQNRGRSECWDEWGFTVAGAPLWAGDVPQARARDDGATVEVANRTQNTFTVDVVARRPSRILINSPYARGWRTDVGTASEENKLLVVDVPEGRSRIHLRYWPRGMTAGLCLSALGVVLVVAFWNRARLWRAARAWRRRRRPRAAH